jgi:hypothetical protein
VEGQYCVLVIIINILLKEIVRSDRGILVS